MLALTREPPYPPNAGDRIVTYGFLRALADRGHDVHLLSYGRPGEAVPEPLRSLCSSVRTLERPTSLLPPSLRKAVRAARGRSDVMAMFDSDAFQDATADRIRTLSPDIVLAQHPYMGQCFREDPVDAALDATGAAPFVNAHVLEYDAHRRLARHAEDWRTRLALTVEVPRLRREELSVYERAARTLVLGEEDRAELDSRVATPVRYQRVGLDVDRYEPSVPAASPQAADGGTPPLLFFGSYDWFPNADAARRLCEAVLPAVRRRQPDAELLLAGRGAGPDVRALGERDGVTFLGEVDDLAPLVKRAAAVVAPLRIGGGTRIKVLESMAWGTPVVTTTVGAEGVEATDGEDIVVADAVDEFAGETARLLRRPDERARLGANARATVERRYSIDAVGDDLERNLTLA